MALFRFRQRQVLDPLAQENFEQLEGVLGNRNAGSGSSVFTASATSADTIVSHGLPKAPVSVVATSTGAGVFCIIINVTDTIFTVRAYSVVFGAVTATIPFYWTAAR